MFFCVRPMEKMGCSYFKSSVRFDGKAYLRTELNLDEPVIFNYVSGRKMFDLVKTGWGSLYLLNDTVVSAFNENNISGWKSNRAILFGIDNRKIDDYHLFSIYGRCGPQDESRSIEVEKQPIFEDAPPYKVRRGFYFDESTWDGSDFFLSDKSRRILASHRVKEVIENLKPTNIEIIPCDEVEY